MELTIEGLTTAQLSGPVTIELPQYMYPLEPEEMAEAKLAENRAELALAAGRHPNGNILFITGDGAIREIDCEKHSDLPKGAAFPMDAGWGIGIQLPGGGNLEVMTGWAINHSNALMSAGVTTPGSKGSRLTYVDE